MHTSQRLSSRLLPTLPLGSWSSLSLTVRSMFAVPHRLRFKVCDAAVRQITPFATLPLPHYDSLAGCQKKVVSSGLRFKLLTKALFWFGCARGNLENVGRQGTLPHGIDIVTAADFFAVGNRCVTPTCLSTVATPLTSPFQA